jgi:methionyl-tRNA synthetase
MTEEYVLICVAWPYANGPLHLGHVAGCYLPPDIQYRFERAMGNRVLMVSGSDEHGTPITVTAEQQGISPQDVVDQYHQTNIKALVDLGCRWNMNVDPRGIEYGGALFNRTSDPRHKSMVQENFKMLEEAGFFERQTMEQYYEIHENGSGRFLPDRYVEGTCPACGEDGARGDQCDACGATYESVELKNPISKMNPSATVEIRPTDHLFYRLDLFQESLSEHAQKQHPVWKSNVRAMTKQWLDMGLRPRAVTRDLEWGIDVPLEGNDWSGKCIYVWFEAVQGYSTCARIWASEHALEHPDGEQAWERWWKVSEDGTTPRHLYFLGKDNIPFHTVIWPAIIMGMNQAGKGKSALEPISLPGPGDLALESNVPAMEYLMLAGGQFSKSRKHAVWLPSFLERYDPDTLRYYLTMNMPENHDTDFNWPDFVEKVNSELIAAYGNFVHRVLTLGARLPRDGSDSPFSPFDGLPSSAVHQQHLEASLEQITESLQRHRYKEALRGIINVSQYGNQTLQSAAPWKHLKEAQDGHEESLGALAFCWRIARFLAITTQPFLPTSAQRLWSTLGCTGLVEDSLWNDAIDWDAPLTWSDSPPQPLFERLDLEAILEVEQTLVEDEQPASESVSTVKGGKKKGGKKMEKKIEGIEYLDFDTFMKVNLRAGRILSVEDHPNADKLYVVHLDDGTEEPRTICAGLKAYYSPEEMTGKMVVFVENLAPRPLRGITSEGMMLAADDGEGNVKLITVDGDISTGSTVR